MMVVKVSILLLGNTNPYYMDLPIIYNTNPYEITCIITTRPPPPPAPYALGFSKTLFTPILNQYTV